MKNERRAKLSKLVSNPGDRFDYEYDFGDGWEHTVRVMKCLDPVPGATYPVCLSGKRAYPPEDCGGGPGYMDLLSVLANPSDPAYEELTEWLEGGYDPEHFDLESVNRLLGEIGV